MGADATRLDGCAIKYKKNISAYNKPKNVDATNSGGVVIASQGTSISINSQSLIELAPTSNSYFYASGAPRNE